MIHAGAAAAPEVAAVFTKPVLKANVTVETPVMAATVTKTTVW